MLLFLSLFLSLIISLYLSQLLILLGKLFKPSWLDRRTGWDTSGWGGTWSRPTRSEESSRCDRWYVTSMKFHQVNYHILELFFFQDFPQKIHCLLCIFSDPCYIFWNFNILLLTFSILFPSLLFSSHSIFLFLLFSSLHVSSLFLSVDRRRRSEAKALKMMGNNSSAVTAGSVTGTSTQSRPVRYDMI